MINKNTFKLETDSGVELWQKKKKNELLFFGLQTNIHRSQD